MSKIQKMKAIHNAAAAAVFALSTVVTMSKIQKMKAIHNEGVHDLNHGVLL